ncbi:sterol desaturase family protein [Flavobacterium sp.]|uniref:sterol desaturase family protein n=1 Tax=Flavobacterium sp. TaxID=239 RepID=UPI0039E49E33
MKTPFELLTEPINLAVVCMYLSLMLWEALFPARKLPDVKFWRGKGILFFIGFFLLSNYLPMLYVSFLPDVKLFDFSQQNVIVGSIAGFLAYELALYTWHRSLHKSDWLWRVFHQMHHSAERIDTFGAFYFSPVDMVGFSVMGTLCFSCFIGLSPEAVTVVLLLTNFFNIFQHANIRTPKWLGYLIQRPESHAMHHSKGIHQYNYCDLPFIDMLFGTFRNPDGYLHENGFFEGASAKIKEMILFRDINKAS